MERIELYTEEEAEKFYMVGVEVGWRARNSGDDLAKTKRNAARVFSLVLLFRKIMEILIVK